MNIIRKIIVLSILLVVICSISVFSVTKVSKPLGERGFAVGAVFPQGDFVTFSDPGPVINFRIVLRPNSFKALGLRLEAGGNLFKSESEPVRAIVNNYHQFVERTVTQTAWTLHTGLQIGSDTRRGLIRPRVSFSPGLYLFNIKTKFTQIILKEEVHAEHDTQLKFGWRAAIGTTLFVNTRLGISFDFLYDHVYSLHQSIGQDTLGRWIKSSQSAIFHSYMVGIVIALEKN